MEQLIQVVKSQPLVAVLLYVLLLSLMTFLLFGYDKFKARSGRWRTPESTLLGFCLLGGTIGGGLAMLLFRHKVSKRSFLFGYWGIVALQVLALSAWYYLASSGSQNILRPLVSGNLLPGFPGIGRP